MSNKLGFNLFHVSVLFLYRLKMSENEIFSDGFRGSKNGVME